MAAAIYTFQRGEPISIAREVLSGDPTGFTVTAKLKPVADFSVPAVAVASVATFESEFVDAAGDVAAHWLFWIEEADADDLPRGRYITDVLFTYGGSPASVSDPLFVELVESVSG